LIVEKERRAEADLPFDGLLRPQLEGVQRYEI
jgi:hypothetical protein